jgi:hypothetical protein
MDGNSAGQGTICMIIAEFKDKSARFVMAL